MTRLLALLAVLFGSLPALAQNQYTAITAATSSLRINGRPVSGRLIAAAVDASGHPIPVHVVGGGLLTVPQMGQGYVVVCTVTNGGVTGVCQVPDAHTANGGAGVLYNLTLVDTFTGAAKPLQLVPGISGASWALDQYTPAFAVAVASSWTVTAGSGSAPTSCVAPAYDFRINGGVATESYCYQGVFVPVGGSGGQGAQGNPGASATVAIGSVTPLAPGSTPTVSNSGSNTNAVFNFGLPTGLPGPQGAQGAVGPQGVAGPQGVQGPQGNPGAVGAQGAQGGVGPAGAQGPVGPQGAIGATGPQGVQGPVGATGTPPSFSVGTVTTVACGTPANVSFDGASTATHLILNFDIPAGCGSSGSTGPTGSTGSTGAVVLADQTNGNFYTLQTAYGRLYPVVASSSTGAVTSVGLADSAGTCWQFAVAYGRFASPVQGGTCAASLTLTDAVSGTSTLSYAGSRLTLTH